tara:strand:+ start:216 stop:365 length:150 start_codon:yes stop_codon:yes gene_type:complete
MNEWLLRPENNPFALLVNGDGLSSRVLAELFYHFFATKILNNQEVPVQP